MSIQLSFIMPTYNSAEYISETLDSLMASIGKHYDICEVICVDDGSSDDTVDIIKKYQHNYPVIQLYQNSHQGVSVSRNIALSHTRGKYVTFVDSDDLYSADFVTYFLNIRVEFDLMFTDVGGLDNKIQYNCLSSEDKLEVFKNTLRIGKYQIEPGVAGKFFNMELVRKHKMEYNSELSVSEDMLFNFEYLSKAETIILDPIKFYNVTGTHSLMYYNEKNLKGQIEFVESMRRLLSNYPDSANKWLLEHKFIINAMTIFIDRYFGPLWLNKTYTLNQSSNLLRETIEKNNYYPAFQTSELDASIGNRYVVFRKLLRLRQYKLCLIYNRVMDKIRGFERFREEK